MDKTALLNSGFRIPYIGFGTATTTPTSHQQLKDAISEAFQLGYRHIDTARVYGSEPAIGEALSEAFKSNVIKRENIFVTSKVRCGQFDDVLETLKDSLRALQLDYLDLYLIHWPLYWRKECWRPCTIEEIHPLDIEKTWKQMEKCAELGLTKSIGVSNFSSKKIMDVLQIATIPPAVNQVEMHPKWQQKQLRETCAKANIHVSAWSPLGAPRVKWGSMEVIEHPVIKEIAEKHHRTPAQISLRWGLEQGASVIVKSYNSTRMKENLAIFDFTLTQEDLDKIATIEQKKNVTGPFLIDGSFYNDPGLWDGEI